MTRKWQSKPISVKNAEMNEFLNKEEILNHWTVPAVPPSQIYKFGTFDFKSRYSIKTMESTVTMEDNIQSIQLSASDLQKYLAEEYKYIHIGLIQIAFKPLTLCGLNASILATLRDARCLDWKPSLMGVIQTSLSHGPVHFNVHPNLSLSLTDKNLYDAISLKIQTHGHNYAPGSETMAIIFRVHFKVMNTLCPKARHISFPRQTVMIASNLVTTNVATNKLLKWEEINFPDSWLIPEAIAPKPIVNHDIEQIVQHDDGDVEISSANNKIRLKGITDTYRVSEPSTSSHISARNSISHPPDRNTTGQDNLDHIRLSEQDIPHGIYRSQSQRLSPSASEMNFHV